jgi:hypothetical protein
MILKIFDDVEVGVAPAEYLERAARVTACGIVIQSYAFHLVLAGIFWRA